ncbi:LysR family transcriptional regulator [Mesorhizobium sp. M0601]|uniref:LysR family transcriptional regulator n=1 Tax=Mesorhizobium sp. M0601 TaxID=2956969 RepID=UPI00333747D0
MKNPLDLHTLQIATAVIESGSMTGAALRFGLTQTAISHAVRRAESMVGVALVHRHKRPLAATEAGLALAVHVREVTQKLEIAFDEVRLVASMPKPLDLRIGLVDTFAATIGPQLLKELVDGAMALRLTALTGIALVHAEALKRHSIDVAITSDTMADLDDVSRYPIFREPYLLVVAKSAGAACRDLSLDAIFQRYKFIRYSARSQMGTHIESHLRRLRLEPPRMLEFDSSDTLLAMVASEVGCAITTPLALLQGRTSAPGLEVLPLPSPAFSREIALVTRRGEFPALAAEIAQRARDIVWVTVQSQFTELVPWLAPIAESVMFNTSHEN